MFVFVGEFLDIFSPSPISPYVPFPHVKTQPNSFTPALPFFPAVISTILPKMLEPPSPTTGFANFEFSLFPVPNSPTIFSPHA
jgi:hypothetical protein